MEEIEELRAKAIASMPSSSSSKPNMPSAAAGVTGGDGGGKLKPLKSREEGEVSSSEDAELATCSVTPINRANLGESLPYTLKNDPINEVKKAPVAHLSTASMQFRTSALQRHQKRYHKHFKRKQIPFRSQSNQALHWHAKEPNNNLVISFSDDSGSEPEECSPEKVVKRMDAMSNAHNLRIDGTSIARNSRIAATSSPKLSDGIEREPNGIKLTLKGGFTNHGTISSIQSAYETSSEPHGTSTENDPLLYKTSPVIKTSSTQELVHAQDSAMADQKLELLRSQISARENQLKVHNKSVHQKVSTACSDSNQNGHLAMKAEALETCIRRHGHDTTLEFEANEPSKKRLKHDKSSGVLNFDLLHDHENDRTFRAKSCPLHQHDFNTVKPYVLKSKDSYSVLSAANLHDVTFSENDGTERNVRTGKVLERVEASNLPSNLVNDVHVIKGKQQPIPTTDVLSPMETFSIYEISSDLGSGNKEANITEEGSIPFHCLANLEEFHDKELEEAQEHRCKCELEERHALIAYRKAQRALVEANERCSFLYGKREIFSAKFRAFLMEASNSICPSNWQCQPIPHEDQFYEPDASTSVHRDNEGLYVAVPPTLNPNMLTDDDGEDFNKVIESGSAHADVQIEKAHPLDNSQDYELLEASLRSKLVARLGLRGSSKLNDTSKKGLDVEKIATGVTEYMEPSPLLFNKVIPSSETKQTLILDGIERTKESNSILSAPLDSQLLVSVSSNGELQRAADLDTNNSLNKDSGNLSYTVAFTLPSSELHSMCKHTHMIFPGCNTEFFNMIENDHLMTTKEMGIAHFVPDTDVVGEVLNFERLPQTGYMDVFRSSVKIDPFWPLCMFEFRGKCNDEECPWQHTKAGMSPNLLLNEDSDVPFICLPNAKSEAPRFPLSALHALPVPIYQIGQYIIKTDSNHSQSVLARSTWQYQQRGFCASFSIPFSVQRILPRDAPCLQSGGDSVADFYSSNRLSLYHLSQDSTLLFKEQAKKGSCDVEQLLEMALDQFDGEFCESDRIKALSLLAHAIESYPSSVLLWVVYLHIYYRKEQDIGKDDMFFHAVQHNKCSYELWLLYINSRMYCDDRLNAYDRALHALCYIGGRDARKHFSSYILDIFLQMIDFLRMCEQVDKAITRICGLLPSNDFEKSSDNPLPDICTYLTVSDKCLFWTCCIFFIVYEKLPEAIVQLFEYVKNMSFRLDWPSVQVSSDRKELALNFMKLAMSEMASHLDDDYKEIGQASLQSLHFLAVCHVKCAAALEGFLGDTELLDKYLKLYPSCMELVLIAIRFQENCASDLRFLKFEEALYHWPRSAPGIQCLWNQYAEHALTNRRIDLVEKLMARWYQDFQEFRVLSSFCSQTNENSLNSSHINFSVGEQFETNDDAFGFLNLCLYWILQKSVADASAAIDKSLELASPEDYIHFVKEHSLFMALINTKSHKYFPGVSLSTLLNRYLTDPRSNFQMEPMSRKFIQNIKKPRIQETVNNILGPISMGSTLVNSVMKVCFGSSFLPEKFNGIKAEVNFVESLMELMPANYELALLVYRSFSRNFIPTNPDSMSLKFWACNLLINSIFQAAPSAPEHTWLEAANVLNSSESIEVALRFHKQAISVYPFSVKLWQSYANLYTTTTGDASEIIEAAQEKGIEMNNLLN